MQLMLTAQPHASVERPRTRTPITPTTGIPTTGISTTGIPIVDTITGTTTTPPRDSKAR